MEEKDTMDGTDCDVHVALEEALASIEDRESSDTDSETEESPLNSAMDRLGTGPGMEAAMSSSDGCIFQGNGLTPGYHHPPRASEPPGSVNDTSVRSPAAASVILGVAPSCEAVVPTNNLLTIIEDDRAFLMFRRFLKDQCITRNLNFWLACEHYRQLPPEEQSPLQTVARAIYIKFIKHSAPQKVTILDQTKMQIKMCLECRSPLTPQLYRPAQQEVWEEMERNEFHQFLCSDAFADCSVFTRIEPSVMGMLYTPNMRKPAYVCRAGSLQNTDSEDSASMTSFTSASDDGGPKSAVGYGQLSRPMPSGARGAVSDTDTRLRRHLLLACRHPKRAGAAFTKENSLSREEFAELVIDRLKAVNMDRETTRKRMQDQARQKGKDYNEIMAIEWYDHPDMVKYLKFDGEVVSASSHPKSPAIKHPMSPAKQTMSPTVHSPAGTPQPSTMKKRAHINSLAKREVEDAIRDLEITSQVTKRRRAQMASSTCSSVLSATSDSGVGDSWATGASDSWQPPTSGATTPFNNVHAYLRDVNMAKHAMGERDRMVQAAAITLITNTPKPEALKPRIPGLRDSSQRHLHGHDYMHNYSGAYTSDDSSSCYTMTSKSSTSDLFIPRRPHHPSSFYSDSEDSHYYPPNRFTGGVRRLTTPKKSHPKQHPSTLQPRMPPSRVTSTRHTEDVLVVYHLDDFPTPYAKRVGGSQLSLGEFKERVFARKGEYRYFFKSYCDDLCMEIMEEFSDDSIILPLTQGKIVGKVEKV